MSSELLYVKSSDIWCCLAFGLIKVDDCGPKLLISFAVIKLCVDPHPGITENEGRAGFGGGALDIISSNEVSDEQLFTMV